MSCLRPPPNHAVSPTCIFLVRVCICVGQDLVVRYKSPELGSKPTSALLLVTLGHLLNFSRSC